MKNTIVFNRNEIGNIFPKEKDELTGRCVNLDKMDKNIYRALEGIYINLCDIDYEKLEVRVSQIAANDSSIFEKCDYSNISYWITQFTDCLVKRSKENGDEIGSVRYYNDKVKDIINNKIMKFYFNSNMFDQERTGYKSFASGSMMKYSIPISVKELPDSFFTISIGDQNDKYEHGYDNFTLSRNKNILDLLKSIAKPYTIMNPTIHDCQIKLNRKVVSSLIENINITAEVIRLKKSEAKYLPSKESFIKKIGFSLYEDYVRANKFKDFIFHEFDFEELLGIDSEV